MARLADLPLDLLPLILDYLTRYDYNALIRVSKSLNKEVTPYLYRDLKFEATKSRQCARNLAFLLRTFLERPQAASYVKTFSLRGPLSCWTQYNPWPEEIKRTSAVNLWGLDGCTTLSKAQKIFVSNQFYQIVDEELHKSAEQFKGRNKDALSILVLTRCMELTKLDLGDGFMMYSLLLPQIMKRTDRLFPKLDHIILGDKRPDPSVSYMDLDLIRPIFYSSSVKTFEYSMSQPWQLRWNGSEAPRSDSLTMLRLFRTNITRATLDQLLSATPHLKRFHYEQEIYFNATTPGAPSLSPYLNLDGLNIALANLKNTLEECRLTLALSPGSLSPSEMLNDGLQFPAMPGTLTVLKDMKNLVSIELPMVMFLGWPPDFAAKLEEVLPSSVRTLTLRDDFVTYCPWAVGFNCNKKVGRIGEYMEQRTFHAPQLQNFKVRLAAMAKNDTWLLDAVNDLGAPLDGRGVRHWVDAEKRADIYCWHFGKEEAYADARKDSIIPGMFPST